MTGLPVRRSPGEQRAYLDGFDAAIRMFEDRLKRHVSGDGSAIKAAAAEVRAIGDVVRDQMRQEGG